MDKYSLTFDEACEFLGISRPTLSQWIKSGRLTASRKTSAKQSPYIITRQACIAAIQNPLHTVAVSAVDATGESQCQSSAEVRYGTRASLSRVRSVLRNHLELKTSAKLRSCTTN
ncbi:helix-turn-helix domain-containing protein [Yersinia nurmii]|uniref:Helix-turn-helix domain-containing protein n=1 Tax=Yersinia nurmii TaxID=685706 RepID=A0AAW7K601_9GAMM|nr:helix-turn-helix domain-containing protein [Yersinia nurmii]MDN0089237.1 helix-turn-helix domain-containing protein [Yersinia nurmii]